MRLLVGLDRRDQRGRTRGIRRDLAVAEQRLRPLEHVLGEDLDHHHVGEECDHVLEAGGELGEHAPPLAAAAAHHREQHVVRDLGLGQAEVARRLPHLLVAALLAEAGLVARVGFEQAVAEVGEGGAREIAGHLARQVGQGEVADPRAEALHDRDRGERPHHRLAHALLQEQLRLRMVRVVRRDELVRDVDQRLAFRA